MFSLHISSNIQKSAPETCYRSKKQQKYKTRKRRKKSGRKMSVDLKRSRKKCALLLTNSNCSIHAQLDMRPNDDFFPLLLTCIGFLGHQQFLDDDDVFIYVSFSLFLFCILRFFFSLTLFFIVIFSSFFAETNCHSDFSSVTLSIQWNNIIAFGNVMNFCDVRVCEALKKSFNPHSQSCMNRMIQNK